LRSLLSAPAELLPLLYHLSPALALSALFFSSTQFTEGISLSKYPAAYKAYQKRVGMFLPVGTLEKWVLFKVVSGKQEQARVEGLIWGDASANLKKE
jgi:hypothetical protein